MVGIDDILVLSLEFEMGGPGWYDLVPGDDRHAKAATFLKSRQIKVQIVVSLSEAVGENLENRSVDGKVSENVIAGIELNGPGCGRDQPAQLRVARTAAMRCAEKYGTSGSCIDLVLSLGGLEKHCLDEQSAQAMGDENDGTRGAVVTSIVH